MHVITLLLAMDIQQIRAHLKQVLKLESHILVQSYHCKFHILYVLFLTFCSNPDDVKSQLKYHYTCTCICDDPLTIASVNTMSYLALAYLLDTYDNVNYVLKLPGLSLLLLKKSASILAGLQSL